MVTSKLSVLGLTWAFAFLVSISLRFWGSIHPGPFEIRYVLVWFFVFGLPVLLGGWILSEHFKSS